MTLFRLDALGSGPWAKRLQPGRALVDELPWGAIAREADPKLVGAAREVWTRAAFAEYASAAAFAEIASALLAAQAPIDLVAAAGAFVADEMVHAELAARTAMALGGAVPLEVDLSRLVKPPTGPTALARAAELVVRTCCVGETLTVPVLNRSRRTAGSPTLHTVISRILKDEAQHAALGWWFLDWAELDELQRAHLGRVAGGALRAMTALFQRECTLESGLGTLDCNDFDGTFADAVQRGVTGPLLERGIIVPAEDLAALSSAMAA